MSAASARLRSPWALGLGAILLLALGLRLWGVRHGLPYVYNADENAHFVPRAIGFFGHDYDPNYFVNPPAFTYLLHVVYWVWYGGGDAVARAYATDPAEVFTIGRVVSALLGTAAIWLTALAGARLLGRRVGWLAAALLAVAFLPVFYGKLALNDSPALAPLALSLLGTAGVLRRGRAVDFAIAGLGLGLAGATKYTAGIALVPLAAAVAVRWIEHPTRRATLVRRVALAGGLAVAAFVVANPYSVLTPGEFKAGLDKQSSASGEEAGKLGLTQDNGWLYYLWTLTWGLGWVPALAALGGAAALWREDRRVAAVLVPAPLLFLAFMGSQERFFGRWLLPVFPVLALLAAHGLWRAVDLVRARAPRAGVAVAAAGVAALLAQGVVTSVHNAGVLSRDDTRNVVRDWLVANVPEGDKLVIEPVVPDEWSKLEDRPQPRVYRWPKFITSRSTIDNRGRRISGGRSRTVNIEDYERTTRPELIGSYERGGYCWVVVGSTQRGRAEAEPESVPNAIAYYRELARRARVAFRASPYDPGAGPVEFNFDWSFDYYPLAYRRPGPEMTVYRLTRERCA